MGFYELGANLVCTVGSRSARAILEDPVSKTILEKTNKQTTSFVCVHICRKMYATVYMQKSEDKL